MKLLTVSVLLTGLLVVVFVIVAAAIEVRHNESIYSENESVTNPIQNRGLKRKWKGHKETFEI